MKRIMVAFLLLSLATSVTVAQKKKSQRPPVDVPPVYRGTPPGPVDSHSIADTKWFDIFRDERLRELIDEAIRYNYDLREAIAHVDEAAAAVGITRSEQFPTIGASADMIVTTCGAAWVPSARRSASCSSRVAAGSRAWVEASWPRLLSDSAIPHWLPISRTSSKLWA